MKYKSKNELESESKDRQPVELPQVWPPPSTPYPNIMQIEEEEINLLDYWHVLMKRKGMILSLIIVAIISSVIASLWMPNIYRAEVVLAPVGEKKSLGGASALLSQFNGLASLAGISLGNESDEVNLAVLKSRVFIKHIVQENKLMPLLFPENWDSEKQAWIETDPKKQPSLWDAYRLLNNILTVSTDRKTGLTTVAMERKDPEQAASWLTLFIETLNNHLKEQAIKEAEANIEYLSKQIEESPILEMRQALYSVIAEQTRQIMLARAQQYFAFKVIDPPEIPDKKYKPKRSMIVILTTFIVAFIALFLAFFMEYLENQKQKES